MDIIQIDNFKKNILWGDIIPDIDIAGFHITGNGCIQIGSGMIVPIFTEALLMPTRVRSCSSAFTFPWVILYSEETS